MSMPTRREILVSSSLILAATLPSNPTNAASPNSEPLPVGVPDIDAHQAIVDAARLNSPDFAVRIDHLLPALKADGSFSKIQADETYKTLGTHFYPIPSIADSVVVWGQDFLFLAFSDTPISISIDGQPQVVMKQVSNSGYWYHLQMLGTGVTHNYSFFSDGRFLGETSVAGYNPLSYPLPGAARGTLSEARTVASRLYNGAVSKYWLYTNPGVDLDRGAPLMIWFDGGAHIGDKGFRNYRLQTVTDNLVHRGEIPPMVHLLIDPAMGGDLDFEPYRDVSYGPATGLTRNWILRNLTYTELSDVFNQHISQEVLPEVERYVKLRQDGYSRGASGMSSGGTAAFKLAWFEPDKFSRVLSNHGTYVDHFWDPENNREGAFMLPFHIRRQSQKNIRACLSDSMNDMDTDYTHRTNIFGSWPLGGLQMAQSLKTKFYDFHLRCGTNFHNSALGALELPESLTWLWRNYTPDKTSEIFEQEATERVLPLFRMKVDNRVAW